MALLKRASSHGTKYALVAACHEKGLFLCNIRNREFTRVKFPADSPMKLHSSCRGLALVGSPTESPSLLIGNPSAGYSPSLFIGNPVAGKWRSLAPHPLEKFNGLLARDPDDNSVHLVACDLFGRKCCTYDFQSDLWIPGPDHGVRRRLMSNLAWHRASLYGVFWDLELGGILDNDSEDEDIEKMSLEEYESWLEKMSLEEYESWLKESQTMGLYRCRLADDPKSWTRLELPSLVKRLFGEWMSRRLIVHNDRLLLYLCNGNHYKITPGLKRKQIHRMFEVFDDGRVAEDESWIHAAEKFDPDCSLPLLSWRDIVYGDDKEDFCWITDTLGWKHLSLHSGTDGSVSRVGVPEGSKGFVDFISFEDYRDGEFDDLLLNSTVST